MVTSDGFIVSAPKNLIVPTNTAIPAKNHGSLYISGGLLIYVSGATLWKVTATAT